MREASSNAVPRPWTLLLGPLLLVALVAGPASGTCTSAAFSLYSFGVLVCNSAPSGDLSCTSPGHGGILETGQWLLLRSCLRRFRDALLVGLRGWNHGHLPSRSAALDRPRLCRSGLHPVRLKVDGSLIDTHCLLLTEPVVCDLVADFSWSPVTPSEDLPVAFVDLTTGGPTVWIWEFDDGTTSTSRARPTSSPSPATIWSTSRWETGSAPTSCPTG